MKTVRQTFLQTLSLGKKTKKLPKYDSLIKRKQCAENEISCAELGPSTIRLNPKVNVLCTLKF